MSYATIHWKWFVFFNLYNRAWLLSCSRKDNTNPLLLVNLESTLGMTCHMYPKYMHSER